jgi:hypothetical protein
MLPSITIQYVGVNAGRPQPSQCLLGDVIAEAGKESEAGKEGPHASPDGVFNNKSQISLFLHRISSCDALHRTEYPPDSNCFAHAVPHRI